MWGDRRVFRFLTVSLCCIVLANCAGRPMPEILTQSSFAQDAWEREPAPRRYARPTVAHAAKSREPVTTGSTATAARDVKPLSPEQSAIDNAEAQRLKNLTNICRC